MSLLKKTALLMLSAGIVLAGGYAAAIPPDFNADRRVNVRCPSSIQSDRIERIELDGFKNTIHRLYHELDKNLQASEKTGKKVVKRKYLLRYGGNGRYCKQSIKRLPLRTGITIKRICSCSGLASFSI